jgi:uncharacterized protein
MAREVALVTGASSGLGAEFARQLGAQGFELVLVARRADRLEKLSSEITAQSGVRCHVIGRDLSRPEAARELFAETTALGLQVDWLVNNAGFGTDGFFPKLPLDREIEQIQVNVTTLVALTHLYLAGMLDRKRGKIINVASVGAFVPTPYMATYSATKAFVLSFSEALASEVSPAGVVVLALCPGATKTEFHDVAGAAGKLPEFAFTGPGVVVQGALAAARRGKHTLVPGFLNKMTVASTRFTPRRVLLMMAGSMFQPQRS